MWNEQLAIIGRDDGLAQQGDMIHIIYIYIHIYCDSRLRFESRRYIPLFAFNITFHFFKMKIW